jgi:hypothetical protein
MHIVHIILYSYFNFLSWKLYFSINKFLPVVLDLPAWFIFLCVTVAILSEWSKWCCSCFKQDSACFLVQIDPISLGKDFTMSHTKAIHKWTMTEFFSNLSPIFLLLSHYHQVLAPLTLKCFANGNSLIFTPFLWNTIVMRKPAIFWEAGEE